MGRRRKFGRPVNGVIVVDKPQGITSNDVVQRIKHLFYANKVGHTGSLDPLATGVLPICLGEATKFSQYLLDSDKAYVSDFVFGLTTDTADAEGKVLVEKDASEITLDKLNEVIEKYRGDIEQIPPMYSALKKDGQPLYKLARQGIEVERPARKVTIKSLVLLDFQPGKIAKARVEVHCTKGTYIRSLADDIGRDLGCGGHVGTLRRVQAGNFIEAQAVSMDDLAEERGESLGEVLDHHLMPMDTPVLMLAKIEVDDDTGHYFSHGQAVMAGQVYAFGDEGDKVRVFCESGDFLGIGEITDDGRIAPKRLVVYSA